MNSKRNSTTRNPKNRRMLSRKYVAYRLFLVVVVVSVDQLTSIDNQSAKES
jgi:hypothetical protein